MTLRISRVQSQALAAALMVLVWVSAYLFHAALNHAFALPPDVLAVLVPLTPVVDVLVAWLMHGLTTGDWSFTAPPVPAIASGQLLKVEHCTGCTGRHPASPETLRQFFDKHTPPLQSPPSAPQPNAHPTQADSPLGRA